MKELLQQDNLFWAFPIEVSLQTEVREIALALHHDKVSEKELVAARKQFVHALNKVIDAGFEFYYQKPTENDGNLSPIVKRTVDSVINTVRHAIHIVVQRVFKNMPVHDLKLMGYYLDSMVIPNNEKYAYLAFPLNETIRSGFINVHRKITRTDHKEDYGRELVAIFTHVVKESTHYYYHAPTDLITLNRIAKKAADISIDGAANGIQKIIGRVIKDISHKQVVLLFKNLHLMLVSSDLNYSVASPHFIPNK